MPAFSLRQIMKPLLVVLRRLKPCSYGIVLPRRHPPNLWLFSALSMVRFTARSDCRSPASELRGVTSRHADPRCTRRVRSLHPSPYRTSNEKPLTVARQGFVGATSFAPDLRASVLRKSSQRTIAHFNFELDLRCVRVVNADSASP